MADILKSKEKVILITFSYQNGETKSYFNPWIDAMSDILLNDESTNFDKLKDIDILVLFAKKMTKISSMLFIDDRTNSVSVVNIDNALSYDLSVAWR